MSAVWRDALRPYGLTALELRVKKKWGLELARAIIECGRSGVAIELQVRSPSIIN